MIELRFLVEDKPPQAKRLQFRVFSMMMHCGWSPWKDVPEVLESRAVHTLHLPSLEKTA